MSKHVGARGLTGKVIIKSPHQASVSLFREIHPQQPRVGVCVPYKLE